MRKIDLPTQEEIEDMKIEYSELDNEEVVGLARIIFPHLAHVTELIEFSSAAKTIFTQEPVINNRHDLNYLLLWYWENVLRPAYNASIAQTVH